MAVERLRADHPCGELILAKKIVDDLWIDVTGSGKTEPVADRIRRLRIWSANHLPAAVPAIAALDAAADASLALRLGSDPQDAASRALSNAIECGVTTEVLRDITAKSWYC